ncbi:MAG: helix-turn-helix domain-containing protein [Clostridiales bacterium]|nr:helix-turn-helix domain-containing protein [Clostridiales bacterium]
MFKLLIVDDEPLVCVGLQSILRWEDFGVEVVGTANNGKRAAEMIETLRPDIVITDIKMPLMSGLELAGLCVEKYGRFPLFIMLTNYEEFDLVKRAIGFQALDYLIKIDLTPEALGAAVRKAISILGEHSGRASASSAQRVSFQSMREKFFLRLYNNLFDSEEQFVAQKESLMIDFSASAYVAAGCIADNGAASPEKQLALCASAAQMMREALSKSFTCYITALDIQHFCIVFCLDCTSPAGQRALLEPELARVRQIVRNYFGVSVRIACGGAVRNPRRLDESYRQAQRLLRLTGADAPLLFYEDNPQPSLFRFAQIRPAVRRAFEELDTAAIYSELTDVAGRLGQRPDMWTDALDAACNILYMAISLLPDGDGVLRQIFCDDPDGYQCIYRLRSTGSVVEWLLRLRDGFQELLPFRRQNHRRQAVAEVKEYIRGNLGKRLTLNNVAAFFNFSPNYLSQQFAKYSDKGFVEYITAMRVDAAKELLVRGELKIYEIADRLGFENADYFSKVFRKSEGVSPREYIQALESGCGG